MKKKLKRFLTLILATCMILGTVSISLAEEAWEKTPIDPGKGRFTKSKTATDWIDDVYADKIMEEYTYAWTDEEI